MSLSAANLYEKLTWNGIKLAGLVGVEETKKLREKSGRSSSRFPNDHWGRGEENCYVIENRCMQSQGLKKEKEMDSLLSITDGSGNRRHRSKT